MMLSKGISPTMLKHLTGKTLTMPQYQTDDDADLTGNDTNPFYDAVADDYSYFYRDWQATMEREGAALRRAFRDQGIKTVLDASCGVGTQSIPLARLDFEVTAVDPSPRMLQKARENAATFGVAEDITFITGDFLSLPRIMAVKFDALISKGNALPHLLTDDQIKTALRGFYDLLRPGGMLVIGIRDFDSMLEDRPRFVPRQVHTEDPARDVILFDLWEWHDSDPVTVTFNTFIVSGKGDHYSARRYPVTYRALRREELEALLGEAGFTQIKVERDVWELVFTAKRD